MKNLTIKVGDYARNKKGIGKIIDIKDHGEFVEIILDDFQDVIEYTNGKEAETLKNKIIMRKGIMRENIKIGKLIDLIEVGDILSFEDGSICRVCGIEDDYYLLVDCSGISYWEKNVWIDDFVSIVTKEQMEAMEYKIER